MKSWGRAVAAAFLFATLLAAAQIGTASILGVLRLDGTFDADTWTSRLTLLSWFTIISVIAGAFAGRHARLSASFAAGIGSALGASAALYPLRTATLPSGDPQLLAGIAIGFAAIAGLILAVGLISARSLGWNAAVTAVLVWTLLALAIPGDARLGQLDSHLSPSVVHTLSLWGLPVALGVLALVCAVVARIRRQHRAVVAFIGLAGPATIALAYAIAGPGTTDAQKIPWTSALLAAAAGLAASLLVALPPRRTPSGADEFGSGSAFPLPTDTLTTAITDPRRPFADFDDRAAPVARPR